MSTTGLGPPVFVRKEVSSSIVMKPTFVRNRGKQNLMEDDGLTYQPSTGTLSSANFSGDGSLITNVSASTAGTVDTLESLNGVIYLFGGNGTSGSQTVLLSSDLRYNITTGSLRVERIEHTGNNFISLTSTDGFSKLGSSFFEDVESITRDEELLLIISDASYSNSHHLMLDSMNLSFNPSMKRLFTYKLGVNASFGPAALSRNYMMHVMNDSTDNTTLVCHTCEDQTMEFGCHYVNPGGGATQYSYIQSRQEGANPAVNENLYLNPYGAQVAVGTLTPNLVVNAQFTVNGSVGYHCKSCIVSTDQTLEMGSYWQAGVGQYSYLQSRLESAVPAVSQQLAINPNGGHVTLNTLGVATVAGIPAALTVNGNARYVGMVQVGPISDPTPYADGIQCVSAAGNTQIAVVRAGNYVVAHGFQPGTNTYVIAGWNMTGVGVALGAGAQAWGSYSDERQKIIHSHIDNVLENIENIRCVRFNFKDDHETTPMGKAKYESQRIGFIAQDILPNYPEAVDTENPDRYRLTYQDMIPVSIAGLKELHAKHKTLEKQVLDLEAKYEALLTRIINLEAR